MAEAELVRFENVARVGVITIDNPPVSVSQGCAYRPRRPLPVNTNGRGLR
jgi:hypothetical protein